VTATLATPDAPDAPDVPSVAPRRSAAGGMSARTAVLAVAALIAVAVAAALFIGASAGNDDPDSAAATRPAPTFSLPELREDRGTVALTATPGTPTVVNFFAAWCEPCKRELPALAAAAKSTPGVTFLGVDHQDSRLDAIELLDAHGVTYPAGYDPHGDIAAKYAVRGLPATAFISADGKIIDFHQGELSAKELRERLDRLTLRKPTA
jgi:DsbE subfamily thiol:disulfide oxidoreductase